MSKLDAVLSRLGMDTMAWSETISCFRAKLELLSEKDNYNKLLKPLFASNNLSNFNAYVFEVMFAFDFESKNHSLKYEIKKLTDGDSSIDFYYEHKELGIYIELGLVQQQNEITESIEAQLAANMSYTIELNGNDAIHEATRLQTQILSKCQKDGNPFKFPAPVEGTLNFIAINLSELHLGNIDKFDCYQTMYGDRSVPRHCHIGVFGMWQDLQKNSPEKERGYYKKFQYFRKTIHGVLFVRYVKDSGCMNRMYIDRELEYFLILNNNLLSQKSIDSISGQLSSFLTEWTVKKDK